MWNTGGVGCLETEESRRSRDHSEFQMKLCESVGDTGFYRQLRTKVDFAIIFNETISWIENLLP